MSNLFGIGLTGLGAAQAGLATTSNNISNVNTPGYSRQKTTLTTTTAGGEQNGVRVTGIERQYQNYLAGQLNDARSRSSGLDTHLGQISQIDNLLGDSEAGLAPLMQQFFSGLQTLAASPADSAARESLLGDANSMGAQFRSFSEYLGDMGKSAETQMAGAVDQINNYASEIANLNKQIVQTQAKTGQPPNNLLDQRDQLVSAMGELVNVKVSVQDGNSYHLSVAGQPMVDANGAKSLKLVNSSQDPTRKVVAFDLGNGRERELSDSSIKGGALGGLLAFRRDSLEPAQLRLDQLAHTIAARVNEVHGQGNDLEGRTGGTFFQESKPVSFTNADNYGNATVDVSFADGKKASADVQASNYEVTYDGTGYQVTRLSDGKTTSYDAGASLSIDGLEIDVNGSPQAGDSFLVKPLNRAAAEFDVKITDTSTIAAAGEDGGVGDNSNALALADLQNETAVGGDTSFNGSYARLVSDIGNKTRSLQVNGAAQETLTTELETAQQSVSGVNLDEERINLLYYQQMYQASARVIETAASLFDSLLGIRA